MMMMDEGTSKTGASAWQSDWRSTEAGEFPTFTGVKGLIWALPVYFQCYLFATCVSLESAIFIAGNKQTATVC
jgi:hypothetical protein